MYNKKSNYQSGNRRSNGSNFGKRQNMNRKNGGFFGRRSAPKVLDPRLFVKKASDVYEEDNHLSEITFESLNLSERLKRNVLEHGYKSLTFIQEKAIPAILDGRDVIGIANTGTGKTAAFLIPLVNKTDLDRNERVLIVAPTRELAVQIVDELTVFTRGMNLDSALLIGGANLQRQEKRLYHNPHFIIGTPGRIRDLIDRKKLNLSMFRNVVLDEVDRMVDIGFINDVKYFVSLLPQKRQSLFFSATVTDKVRSILRDFVSDPVTITVKKQESAENVDQDIVRVRASEKINVLHDLLVKKEFEKVMVFGRTKWGIEKLTHVLIERGFKAISIHGNKSQGQRQRAITEFKQNKINILLATDVASRGLDIENVTHVINFDPPETHDDYVHRIGRTGRAGKKGVAITFVAE